MRASSPTVHCDGEDGYCEAWDVDFYTTCADTVGGVKITAQVPAPGWTVVDLEDFCPTCTAARNPDPASAEGEVG